MIRLALVATIFLAATSCDKTPSTETDRSNAKAGDSSDVAWSCEYPKKQSCREHDHGMYFSQSEQDKEAAMKKGLAECEEKGRIPRKGPCPDSLRKLICHMTSTSRTMSANPMWKSKTDKERGYWCPIGRLEDRLDK